MIAATRSASRGVAQALALALAGVLLGALPVAAQTGTSLDAATLFKRCSPSVVTIETPEALGSGVIIDAGGLIVTNLHVIRGASEARISLADGRTFDAPLVISVDDKRDLAVLKINASGLTALTLGDPDAMAIGHVVYAIGAPKGLDRTLSQGLLSGVRMRDDYRVLQISAAISGGSSGGALLNDRGELVGITTFQLKDSQNLNFAVPVTYVKPLMTGRPTTLAETAAKYPEEKPAGNEIPTLAKAYVASNGSVVGFEQNGPTVEAAFMTAQGTLYGRTTFTWDPERQVFAGTGALQTPCAAADGTPLIVPIKEELLPVDPRTIRNRWTKPVMNCVTREAQSYTWDETLWFVVEK